MYSTLALKVFTGEDADENCRARYTHLPSPPYLTGGRSTVHTDNWRAREGKQKREAQRPAVGNKCLLCRIPTKTAAQTPDGFVG